MWSVQLATIKDEINKFSNINGLDYYLYTSPDNEYCYGYELELIRPGIFLNGERRVVYLPFSTIHGNIKVTKVLR